MFLCLTVLLLRGTLELLLAGRADADFFLLRGQTTFFVATTSATGGSLANTDTVVSSAFSTTVSAVIISCSTGAKLCSPVAIFSLSISCLSSVSTAMVDSSDLGLGMEISTVDMDGLRLLLELLELLARLVLPVLLKSSLFNGCLTESVSSTLSGIPAIPSEALLSVDEDSLRLLTLLLVGASRMSLSRFVNVFPAFDDDNDERLVSFLEVGNGLASGDAGAGDKF